VGQHVADILANKYGSVNALIDADFNKLSSIREIGQEIAESVTHFFNSSGNKAMLEEFKKLGVKPKRSGVKRSDELEGKTFVLTGELNDYKRSAAKAKITSLGGRVTSSVSNNTDYLVVADEPGRKLNEAKKRNVEIIDEKRFRELVGDI
jgi:DNA ligase (NAD+)